MPYFSLEFAVAVEECLIALRSLPGFFSIAVIAVGSVGWLTQQWLIGLGGCG